MEFNTYRADISVRLVRHLLHRTGQLGDQAGLVGRGGPLVDLVGKVGNCLLYCVSTIVIATLFRLCGTSSLRILVSCFTPITERPPFLYL